MTFAHAVGIGRPNRHSPWPLCHLFGYELTGTRGGDQKPRVVSVDVGSFTEPTHATVGDKLMDGAVDVNAEGAPRKSAVSLQYTGSIVHHPYVVGVRIPLRPLPRFD